MLQARWVLVSLLAGASAAAPAGWGTFGGKRIMPARSAAPARGLRPADGNAGLVSKAMARNSVPAAVGSRVNACGGPEAGCVKLPLPATSPAFTTQIDNTLTPSFVEKSDAAAILNPSGTSGGKGRALAVGDLDGDGDLDIMLGSADLNVLINDGIAGFTVGSVVTGSGLFYAASEGSGNGCHASYTALASYAKKRV